MVHRPRAAAALLVALLLSTAAPAAIGATDAAQPDVSIAAATPLNRNILRNGGFEATATDGSIPGWTVEGDVRVERFGARDWPYPAYGHKYDGGDRYLGCSRSSGLVRQTVAFTDRQDRTYWIKAHLQADFGGLIGQSIRVTIRAIGPGVDRVGRELKPLIITNHYKRAVAHVFIPPGTDRLVATVELVGTRSGARCRMVADTIKLIVLRV